MEFKKSMNNIGRLNIYFGLKFKKNKFNCEKGAIFTGLSVLYVFYFVIIGILLLNFTMSYQNIVSDSKDSNSFNYIIQNHNKNIEILSKETIQEVSDEVIHSKSPCYNSREIIKDKLQKKLDKYVEIYKINNGITIQNEVLSISNGESPFYLNVKVLVSGKKGKETYDNLVESSISIEGFKDPLPFLMCREHPTLIENGTKINYKDSLVYYMNKNNLLNGEMYENATSPLIIKKCIYDPYENHGKGYCLKNCIDNGYFHESADGSCYLCRLEGKGGCPHYGLEVFIVPQPKNFFGNMSQKSICGSDHVIFKDHYPGSMIEFYKEGDLSEILFIDDSHKEKYGII